MKLVIHTQYYPPEIGAPQARLSELATMLAKKGVDVTILTAMPNYPHGKILDGYGGLRQIETQNGIRIVRTWIYPTQSAKLIPRLANYFSFVFSSLLIGGWSIGRADYLLTESPPLFLGMSGFLLSRWKRAKWLFNVSDLWPESAVRLGVLNDGWALRVSQWLERFCYQQSFAVTGQSKSILGDIEARFPDVRRYHLSNGVDTTKFGRKFANPAAFDKQEGQLIAIYAGLHGLAQGLDQVLHAADQLRDLTHLRFVLIGDGPEKQALIALAKQLGLENVSFWDPLPKASIPPLVAAADMALVPLKLFLPGAVPSKVYEAMASSIPVVLVADGEAADIVRENEAGVVVTMGDVEQLAAKIRFLAENSAERDKMGTAGRRSAETKFDRAAIAARFHQFLGQHV